MLLPNAGQVPGVTFEMMVNRPLTTLRRVHELEEETGCQHLVYSRQYWDTREIGLILKGGGQYPDWLLANILVVPAVALDDRADCYVGEHFFGASLQRPVHRTLSSRTGGLARMTEHRPVTVCYPRQSQASSTPRAHR